MNEILVIIDKLALFTFIVFTMLGAGLGLTIKQIWEPLRSPRLVILSLLTNFILVPSFVYLLVQIVPLSEALKDGLLIMALASGPPALPKLAQIVKGNIAFSVGLMMLLMLGTIFYMPLVLPLVVQGVQINSWDIGKPLLLMMISPLVIGLFIKAKFAAIAPVIQPILFKLSSTGLFLGLVVRLIIHTNDIIGLLKTGAIFICAVFIIFSFSVGYLLGGPGIDTQRVLGVGTAQRNFAAALLVGSSNFDDPNVVSIIMVTSILMMITVLIVGPKFIELDQPKDGDIKQLEISG
ncbi:sodium symporter [Trichormus variabilis ATCC 29413]|uniref:Sodium symporter n=2 Tax=Anabaena variabilis TaxID=264691 RepID=Q3MH00_TRIV2|nr:MULTISPECIES: bile acid:sodium symporter [Nostocaceae]MBC1303071.1 sodium:proton symporter [Trichormus variabilis N2B]ABA19736.1 sodium symporter [Trichormus variabilis ATCC 29413]MBC1214735.1 sodium:proton symporter [Trichormus variabilis ARAD]MBC1257855.1 sodium:proton symporter [Trichormus variabilis V5]MBC1267383.1 sodium:proton symporter [Trichormus variabilis FSR]